MQMVRALAILATAYAITVSSATAAELRTYKIDLMPPPPGFHERMGGLPKEISPQTFHAAYGTLTIHAYDGGHTTLAFDFHGLLPYGVYTLWDVVNPEPTNFADRPLANAPQGVAAAQPHWWESVAFDKDGGPGGFGSFGFMADLHGDAQVVVALDHRPGKEFLLDYHANAHVRGGKKGVTVFPGVLWAKFPEW
jgi:hypothetical protein